MGNPNPRLTVYFTKEEIAKIAVLADAEYMSASAYVRKKLAPITNREFGKLKAKGEVQ